MSLKELILISQINQKNAWFAIISILKTLVKIMNHMFVMHVTPVEVIKKGAFGGTYFRNIYSGINDKLKSRQNI